LRSRATGAGAAHPRHRGRADRLPGRRPADGPYPGAEASVATWAGCNGCVAPAATGTPFDADDSLPGAETEVGTYAVGCRAADVELWSIVGGAHLPEINATFRERLVAWLGRATTTLLEDGFESGDPRAWSAVAGAP